MKLRSGSDRCSRRLCGPDAGVAGASPIFDITIDGSDAIWLAGRTDSSSRPRSSRGPAACSGTAATRRRRSSRRCRRSSRSSPATSSGRSIRRSAASASSTASARRSSAPAATAPAGSSLTAFGGISGYIGPQGPLVGVFLADAVPSAGPPAGWILAGRPGHRLPRAVAARPGVLDRRRQDGGGRFPVRSSRRAARPGSSSAFPTVSASAVRRVPTTTTTAATGSGSASTRCRCRSPNPRPTP